MLRMGLSGKEPGELQPNVAGPCAIPILWQLAVLILANAQHQEKNAASRFLRNQGGGSFLVVFF